MSRLKHAYNIQKWHAVNRRSLDWQLSYDEWLKIWQDSGHLHERGKGIGCYNMCRVNDIGPYSVDNVFIGKHEDNANHNNHAKKNKAVIVDGVYYPSKRIALESLDYGYKVLQKKIASGEICYAE